MTDAQPQSSTAATHTDASSTAATNTDSKDLLITLDSITLNHGRKVLPVYFVILFENLTGTPSTPPSTLNRAMTSVMPDDAGSNLDHWMNAFNSPIFPIRTKRPYTFPGGYILYYDKPGKFVSFYFAAVRSHRTERDIGKTLSKVMTNVSSNLTSLATSTGDLASDRSALSTDRGTLATDQHSLAQQQANAATRSSHDQTGGGGTPSDHGAVKAVRTAAGDVATAAAAVVAPEAGVIANAASAAFNAIGTALAGRGDHVLYTKFVTLHADGDPPYSAGKHSDWGSEKVAVTFEIDY